MAVRRLVPMFMLFVISVMGSGCVDGERRQPGAVGPTTPASTRPAMMVSGGDYIHYFEAVEDITRLSDEVIVGTVTSERRGQGYSVAEEPPLTPRILSIRVERRLKGNPDDVIEVQRLGWRVVEGAERELVSKSSPRLSVGDRGVFALVKDKSSDLRGFSNDEAVYLLRDGQVIDTDRRAEVARTLEAYSEQELISALTRAR
jgi:hypothetical protein